MADAEPADGSEAPPAEAPVEPAAEAPPEAPPAAEAPPAEAPPPEQAEATPEKETKPTDAPKDGSGGSSSVIGEDGAGKKPKRRGSMFAEATEAKDLLDFTPGGDITSTLQAFFKEKSTSAEKIPVKRLRRPKLIYENTFRLESKKPFVSSRIEPIIYKTLEEILEKAIYHSKTANMLGSQIAEKIRNRVLNYDYERYKIVVHVALGSMSRQGVFMACKAVGDPNRDSYAYGSFKNHFLYAAATVHAIYYE